MQCLSMSHARSVAAGLLLSCQPQEKGPHSTDSLPTESLPTDTGTHSGDTDSAAYTAGTCPPYSGFDAAENPWEARVYYLVGVPPYQVTEILSKKDGNDTDFTVIVQTTTNEAAPDYLLLPQHFTTRVFLSGQIEARCDEDGYWERGRTLTWTIQDVFDRYTLTTTTTVTWDPPILVVPADLAPSVAWDIDTTQTTRYGSGAATTETIRDTRTGLRIETISWGDGSKHTEALLVESSTGHQIWYHRDYGLVRGDGLTAVGGGYGDD